MERQSSGGFRTVPEAEPNCGQAMRKFDFSKERRQILDQFRDGNEMEVVLMLLSLPLALAGGFAMDSATNDDHEPEDAAPQSDSGMDPDVEPIV